MNVYVSTEKSLKKWLKTKIKVTTATVVGFLIAGTVAMGAEITEGITVNSAIAEKITKSDNINMNLNGTTALNGIFVSGENLKDKNTFHELGVQSDKINIDITTTAADATGVYIAKGGKITLGTSDTESIVINTKSQSGYATGLQSIGNTVEATGSPSDKQIIGGPITVNGKSLDIVSNSKSGLAAGIWVQTNTIYSPEELENKIADGTMVQSGVILNAEKSTITVNSNNENRGLGIVAYSNSFVEVNGDLEIKQADDTITKEKGISAISTRGHSTIKINENNQNTVKIDGDIEFSFHKETSNTTVDAEVILNLSNTDSFLNGKIFVEGNPPKEKMEVNSMKLGLSNGGTWNVTGDSFVNELTLDGGIINVLKTEETGMSTLAEEISNEYYQGKNDGTTTLNIGSLTGKGGTVTVASNITDDRQLEIQKVVLNIEGTEGSSKPNLEVGLSGVNTDELAENNISTETALEKLTNKVVGKDGANIENIDQTLFVDGGTLTGKVTADLENGKVTNIQQAKDTPTTAAIRDLTAINYLSWKQEMSSLSQRMGELRDSSAEHGVWARVYGGKVENGSQYDNKYQTYQVGYDKKYTVDNGRVYLGYLVSYTDGETDYSYGTGENYSVGAGIYATWMNNNGHYVDVLYKVSRLNNKFDMKDVEDVKGDYDTYGISLSAEYGKRFDITEKWFAEPSVGMHLGRLGDETYTTDGGIEVSQDSIYTAEGRVGAAVGYKFSDKGNVYARTHVVKEFAGDVDTEYERKGAYNSTSEDFGDTWFEFGVGVNYRFIENMNVYVDVQKTGEATVDNKWQGNLGFRYEF